MPPFSSIPRTWAGGLQVATADIADSAVTAGKIASGAVTAAKIGSDAVTTAKVQDGAVTSAKLATAARTHQHEWNPQIAALGAGADIAAVPIFKAPAGGCTLTEIGIVPHGASAGIDDANTAVIAVADAAGNAIVTKTYNTATQPPAAKAYASLGALDATHKVLTANEVVTLVLTQGAAADLSAAGFSIFVEYLSA